MDSIQIPNYKLYHDNLLQKNNLARSGLLINNEITHKFRPDLMNKNDAHTVVTVYLTKNQNNTF